MVRSRGGRSRGRGRAGGALVFALIAVVVVMFLATSFMQLTSAVTKRQACALDTKRAFYVAEAGLSEAYAGLTIGKTGAVGTNATPAVFGEGLFWVESTELDEDLVQLDATARVGTGHAELSIVAERGLLSIGSLGVFADQPLTLPPGTLIDAYDSAEGDYGEEEEPAEPPDPMEEGGEAEPTGVEIRGDRPAQVGSNGHVYAFGTEGAPVRVHGDVLPGSSGTLTAVGNVEITGATEPRVADVELPAVVVPPLALGPGIVHDSAVPLVLPAGETAIEYLAVGADAEVVIEGPGKLLVESLVLAPGGTLHFDTANGRIEVVATEGVELAAGSNVTFSGVDPQALTLCLAGEHETALRLHANGPFYGVVYAPQSPVEIAAPFELFGTVVADELLLVGAVQLHFDLFLTTLAAAATLPTMVSWRIVELRADSIGGATGNPFLDLGIDPTTCLPPAHAHADQALDLMYYDLGGSLQVYTGPESAFDWTTVGSVVQGSRDGAPFHGSAPKGGGGGMSINLPSLPF